MRRSIPLILALIFCAASAQAAPRIAVDPAGNFYRYWVDNNKVACSKSIDQGRTFAGAQAICSFTQEVQSCDLKVGGDSNFYLACETSGEVFFQSSSGQKLLSNNGHRPALAVWSNRIAVAWEEERKDLSFTSEKVIYYCLSEDGGYSWGMPVLIQVTGEALSSPLLAADNLGNTHLILVAEKENLDLKRLYHTLTASPEPEIIFETYDDMVDPRLGFSPWGPLIFWQKGDGEACLMTSPDQGDHFGNARVFPSAETPLHLGFHGGKWMSFSSGSTLESGLSSREIFFPAPSAPQLLLVSNSSSPEVIYRLPAEGPQICKIEVAGDNLFSPDRIWTFEQLNPAGTPETSYKLPVELPEGSYFLRLSAFDGLTTGPFSNAAEFKIDLTPPVITLISPSTEAIETGEILLKGKVSEAVRLCLNGAGITPEASGEFNIDLTLQPGQNLLIFSATDEAGNSAFFQKTLSYSAIRPEIKVLKPGAKDWFKPDSTIFIEAQVRDPQNDLEDESEAELSLSGNSLEDRLIFAKDSGKLSGFVTLPPEIPDGKIPAKIKLSDTAGNTGEADFYINVDRQPPALSLCAGEPLYYNCVGSLVLPIADDGAGTDPAGSLVRIAGVSLETTTTAEGKLALKNLSPLADGTYEVEVTPRDLVGNTGEPRVFTLIVDTFPPVLILLSTPEARKDQGKVLIEGEVYDAFLSDVKIYDNQNLLQSFLPQEKVFSREITLLPGNNGICLEAWDRAGNRSCHNFCVFSSLRSAGTLITDYKNGPNPFSRKTDGQIYFTYNLSSLSSLKVYIFNLSGALIWKKELNNVPAGYHNDLTWNGIDHFGAAVVSGVYPYLLQVTAGGVNEIKRGKILVFQ